MAQGLEENRNLSSLRKLLPGNVTERSSTADIAMLLARCLANYGERKGIDMRLLMAEWHATLGGYPIKRLNAALSEHIRKSTFWPTIAEVLSAVRSDIVPPQLPVFREPKGPDMTPEEISRRVAIVSEAKRKYGYSPAFDAWEDCKPAPRPDTGPFVVETSDISDALRAVLMKQTKGAKPCV